MVLTWLLVGPDPFWSAIKDDSVNEITSRIRTGAVDANTSFYMSPLHYAIICGSVNSVKALIQNKANPNQLDSAGMELPPVGEFCNWFWLGQSALLYAIEKQSGQTSADIVDLLLAAGANVHDGDTSDNMVRFSPRPVPEYLFTTFFLVSTTPCCLSGGQ